MKYNLYLLGLLCVLFSSEAMAQTPLPYYTGFDNASEKAGWTEYRKGDNGLYQWKFININPVSAPGVLLHNYPVGGSVPTDDWFVSPPFNFSNGGKLDSIYFSFTGFGVPALIDTVAIYLLQGNADPALATTSTTRFQDQLPE